MMIRPTPADDFAAQARTDEMLAQTPKNQRAILEALRESIVDGTPLAQDIDALLPNLTDERLAMIADNRWWNSLGEAEQAAAWVSYRAALEDQRLPYPGGARIPAEQAFVAALRRGDSPTEAGRLARLAFLEGLAGIRAPQGLSPAPQSPPKPTTPLRPSELTAGVEDLEIVDAEVVAETPQEREAREAAAWRRFHRERFGYNA